MERFSKQAIKAVIKAALAPMAIVGGIVVAIGIILGAAVYFLTIDDGTYKEDDWSNAPFVAQQYNDGVRITKDGYLATSMSLNELWEKMIENHSRVPLYLNGPKEYLQMMYAQMVTQLPDLREDTSKIRTMEEWKEVFDNIEEEEGKFETFQGSSNASSGTGDFDKFDLSDAEVRGLTAVALQEQGSVKGAAAEASLMANLYEERGSSYSGIVDYVLHGGWFATASTSKYSGGTSNEEAVAAVRSVLIDGKRTLPKYVNEHDYRGDIISVTNDGVEIDKYNNSAYIQHKTIIKNSMGSTYTFYSFPAEGSDPFGYTSQAARDEFGDGCYGGSSSGSTTEMTGYKTNIQGGIIRLARNLVTGESDLTEKELEKAKTDYENYKDDFETKKVEREKEQERRKKENESQSNKNNSASEGHTGSGGHFGEGTKEEEKDKDKKTEGNISERQDGVDNSIVDESNIRVEFKSEEDTDELLEFEEWMKLRGYTKEGDKWKRKGQKVSMTYVEPKVFNEYINQYRTATTAEAREKAKQNALTHFTLEKGSGKKGSGKSDSLDDFLYIGDSIAVGLTRASLNEENQKAISSVEFKADIGKSANYFLGEINNLPVPSAVKGVCVMLGVNNPGNTEAMNNLIQKLNQRYPDVNIYIQKVLPVGTAYNNAEEFNATIDNYNNTVKEYCEQFENVYFIDTTDGYVSDSGFLKKEMSESDGLHLKADKYDKLVENILEEVTGKASEKEEKEKEKEKKEDKDKDKEKDKDKDSSSKSNSQGNDGSFTLNEDELNSDPDFTVSEQWQAPSNPYAPPYIGQCTWFAWGKFYAVYGFSPGFTGNGYECVDQLVATHPDKFEKSDTPVVGSVFSWVNHVGLVTKVDGENISIQDGNILGGPRTFSNLPTGQTVTWRNYTMTLSEMRGNAGLTFANPIGSTVGGGKKSSSASPVIKIATWEEVTTSYSTDDPNDANGEAYGATTSYAMKTETINYYDMVKQYTMPFDYLWDLMVVSEDRGFMFELLRIIYESDIEITINDSVKDTTVETTNTYTVTETASASGHAVIRYWSNPTGEEIREGMEPKSGTTTVTASYKDKEIFSESYSTYKYVRTITNTVKVALTRANVWIVDYTKNFIYKEEPTTVTTTSSELPEETTAFELQGEDISYLGELALGKVNGDNKKILNIVVDGGNRKNRKHNRQETVKTTTHIQEYEEGEKSLREKTGKVLKAKKTKNSKIKFVKITGEVDIFEDLNEENLKSDEDAEITEVDKELESDKKQEETKEKDDEKLETDGHTGSGGKIEDTKEKDKEKEGETEKVENTGNLTTEFVTSDTFRYKEKNFVTLLLSYNKGRTNILNAASWLFELLESKETTVEMVDLTKYLLYKATDDDKWGVTYFDFSIFDPDTFNEVSGLCGETPEEQIWYALRSAGYSEEAAAGALGNIYGESGCRFDAIEGGSGEGIGICQWSFGRKQQLINYANSRGKEWQDPETQINFLLGELDESGGADGYASFGFMPYHGFTKQQWVDANTPEAAAEAFMWSFERPGVPRLDVRQEAARRYYEKFKGIPLSYFSKSGGSGSMYESAKTCWEKLCKIQCEYLAGPRSEWIPLKSKNQGIQCSGLVDWALYEMGYKEFKNNPCNAAQFYDGDWKTKYGWEVINATTQNIVSQLKPGDIVVRKRISGAGASGHIQIVAEVKNGRYTVFDAGSSDFWKGNSKAEPVDWTEFGTGNLPDHAQPRIIRVNK